MIPVEHLPLNTDADADRLAHRRKRLDARKQRIEERHEAQVERYEARIQMAKARLKERLEKIDEVRKPIGTRLIDFVINVRKHKKYLTLSTGTLLTVSTNYKVVAKQGDDDAVVAELEAKGHGDMVRVKKEPNRQLLAQRANRHIVDDMETLDLEPVRTLRIDLALD